MDATNDATLSQDERTAALREAIRGEAFPEWVPESNNHIHTCYSFSPYTPTHAALLARRAGLRVVGSVDHDSIAAAPEMTAATRALGMGSVTGFEIRARFDPDGPLRAAALRWRCDIHDGVPNWASWRVARGLGFRREGRVRSLLVNDGVLRDGWVGTLLPGDPRRPAAPWDGPAAPGRPGGSRHTRGAPLVEADGVGEREGDDPEALVRRFHHLYGLPVRTDGPGLERESLHMRMSLIAEEFAELVGAVYGAGARARVEAAYARAVADDDGERDTAAAADALADLVYVVYGMALETGIDLAAVLAEVQRSNMSKLGADGRPVYREDGKVLKGPGYFPPDVAGVLGIGS